MGTSNIASGAEAPLLETDSLRLRGVAPNSLPDYPAASLGRFFQAQRANWGEQVESIRVLDTVLRGYKLQFRRLPLPFWAI